MLITKICTAAPLTPVQRDFGIFNRPIDFEKKKNFIVNRIFLNLIYFQSRTSRTNWALYYNLWIFEHNLWGQGSRAGLHERSVEKVKCHRVGVVFLHHLAQSVQLARQGVDVVCVVLRQLLQHVRRLGGIRNVQQKNAIWWNYPLKKMDLKLQGHITSGSKLDVELCVALRLCL